MENPNFTGIRTHTNLHGQRERPAQPARDAGQGRPSAEGRHPLRLPDAAYAGTGRAKALQIRLRGGKAYIDTLLD
jgi:hypothetical protein